jgi:hypothetical protein
LSNPPSSPASIDTTLLAALLSALISAVVSFLVVWYKTYVLDPKEREAKEKIVRKQLLTTWLAHMKSNQKILLDKANQLEKLTVDERPLDQIAARNSQLVETMTDVRRKILTRNRKIELYDTVLGPQLKYLVMPSPLRESVPVNQFETGESDIAMRLQKWRDDYLSMLDTERMPLLHFVEQLMKAIEKSLAQEEDV